MDYLSFISFMHATFPDHLETVKGSSGEATGLQFCVLPALPISSDQASTNPIPASVVVPSVCLFLPQKPPSEPGPFHSRGFYITHPDAPQPVGLLWTSNQGVADTT